MSKVDPDQVIYEYLKAQNRPYSATDLHLNLQKKIGKTQIIKSLEILATAEKLTEKVFGKVNIFRN
jgi:Fe2+ or Zn2+ uptake regulation protein